MKLINLFAAGLLASCCTVRVEDVKPWTTPALASTSVKIVNMAKNSGGTGVIYKSSSDETVILTNRHVCLLTAEGGGFVEHEGKYYPVIAYKPSNLHDLCFVKIGENLGIDTSVALLPPTLYSKETVSGHPRLLPHVASRGEFSKEMEIELFDHMAPCEKEDLDDADLAFPCAFFGMKPVYIKRWSQLITSLIMPGNSGSAVFNEDGEIAGLVFAGMGRDLSYGFIVPHRYVLAFVSTESKLLLWQAPDMTKKEDKKAQDKEAAARNFIFSTYPKEPSTLIEYGNNNEQ